MWLTPWNSDLTGNPFESLSRDLGRLFGSVTGEGPAEDGGIRLNLEESDEAFTVSALVPGAKPEDLSVSLEDGYLSLRWERERAFNDDDGEWRRQERRHGVVERKVKLPEHVDAVAIAAEYADGVLGITLPKSETAKPRQINVKHGA
jgi:HSP20 family protein